MHDYIKMSAFCYTQSNRVNAFANDKAVLTCDSIDCILVWLTLYSYIPVCNKYN